MINYYQVALVYAQEALLDEKREKFCLYIQQAARRFFDDLVRSLDPECQFYFDENEAAKVCRFIEKLPHVQGVWETPNIVLHASHIFFLVQLFGFRNRKTGYRRFTSALFAVARKNGKSTLASVIMIYCLCHENEPGSQIVSAATTYDQASIIFKISKMMVDKTAKLREAFGLQSWAKTITRLATGSNYKAIHAKASTQDGLNPSHVALDEIHAHKNSDLVNVLTSAAGARANPLWLYTTTEGYLNPGPWGELRDFAKKLLKGVFGNEADHFLVVFYALDDENKELKIEQDDELDPTKWVKANPLIDVNPHLFSAIEKEAIEAKKIPSKMAEFRIKRANRQASTADGWINLTEWKKCDGKIDLEWLKKFPCYAGLDLASTTDLASYRLVWDVESVLYTYGWRWVPEDAVVQRSNRGIPIYASWVEEGILNQTEGNVTDYSVIKEKILEINKIFNIVNTAYDPWNARQLVNELLEKDIPLIEFVQGTKSFHPAMTELELAYLGGKLNHAGDKILQWCASNLVARRDINLNMAPDKKKSSDKIDDIVALLMAVGLARTPEEKEPDYSLVVL